jgi:hypothetical protein
MYVDGNDYPNSEEVINLVPVRRERSYTMCLHTLLRGFLFFFQVHNGSYIIRTSTYTRCSLLPVSILDLSQQNWGNGSRYSRRGW